MGTDNTLYDETVKYGYGKLLSSQKPVNVSSVAFALPTPSSAYDSYRFELYDVRVNTAGAYLMMLFSINGSTWVTANYYWGMTVLSNSTAGCSFYNASGAVKTSFQLCGAMPTAWGACGEILFAPRGSWAGGINSLITNNVNGGGVNTIDNGGVLWDSSGVPISVLFLANNGLLTMGRITLYGLRTGAIV